MVGLDEDSAGWVRALSGTGAERDVAFDRLHEMLVRAALREVHRRATRSPVTGPELTDVAHQAASDAMVAILAKLATFRGESRFTTWAYRFVVLEVASKLGRHHWRRHPDVALDREEWERLPDRLGLDPGTHAESAELAAAVRRAVDGTLTIHQRRVFVAIVVDGVPLDALVARLGVSRNALYKVVFDARGKIRSALVATGTCGAPRAGGPKPAAGANAKAARKATKQTAKGEAATAEGRVYRRSSSDLASVYQQAGSVAAVADHYNVPRHTAQGWIRTLRRRQASPAD